MLLTRYPTKYMFTNMTLDKLHLIIESENEAGVKGYWEHNTPIQLGFFIIHCRLIGWVDI